MSKSLVIVESPSKAKTIEKYLGKNFRVKASVGHVKDLPKSKLGVDVDNNFEPTYEIIANKKKVIEELRKEAESADTIYLALDPDREGEAIAWHVADELTRVKKGQKKSDKPIHRVLFNEITPKAIKESMANPLPLNKELFDAQQARRVLDRLVGYQVSPLLWDKVKRGLSAGRVQTVALRILCEREREIRAFVPEEYWSMQFHLQGSIDPSFWAKLHSYEGKKIKISNEADALKIKTELAAAAYLLKSIQKKERKRNAYPPFITSKMQQEASQKLGFSATKTMTLAQQLYEGMDLGDGPVGLITYMRTDSTRISDDAIQEVRGFVEEKWGKNYLPEKPNFFRSKKGAQDAHEAIRPTSVLRTPDSVKGSLDRDQFRLYELIWKRFVACQMVPALFDQTTFDIEAGSYGVRATGSVMKFAGFLAAYQAPVEEETRSNAQKSEDDEEEGKGLLPDLKEGETLKLLETKPEQHFTEPPPRFSDATLIKELEEKGIGRPSTYASILSNLMDREYVSKEQKTYQPTDLGFIVNDILVENFPNIFNVEFTARMEGELDDVEDGKHTYVQALQEFYGPFKETLEKAKVQMKDLKRQEIPTSHVCEKCGSIMVIKWGRNGEFLSCAKYPECKSTQEFKRDDKGEIVIKPKEETKELCPQCTSPMIVKSGRFGKFLACSKYPDCKTTKSVAIEARCPECHGEVAEKRSHKGKSFYGCLQYPKCRFASWDPLIPEACPLCQSPSLAEKKTKTSHSIRCAKAGCTYVKPEAAEKNDGEE